MDSNTLLAYQPDYYKESKVMQQINNTNAIELNKFNNEMKLIANNYDIDTADSDTLSRWEKEFGLNISPNDTISYRLSRIYSKFRGQGNFTVDFIKNVAKSFKNGDVNVINNNSDYSFSIEFASVVGIPPNFLDFTNVIEEIKPAHLAVNYLYSYLLIKDVNIMKISDLNNTKLNKFAGGA